MPQTGIHMAMQELFGALSLKKSNNPLSYSKACNSVYPNTTRSIHSSSTHAWSTENVSRLLECRKKRDSKWLPQMIYQAKNPCATNGFWSLQRYVIELFGHEICYVGYEFTIKHQRITLGSVECS
ncbi:hypothetical protein AAC387_Pa02g3101 [Persea americana]